MNKKLKLALDKLIELFPEATVQYIPSDVIHRFRIDFGRYEQWVIYSIQAVEERDDGYLCVSLETSGLIEEFKKNPVANRQFLVC